MNITKNSALIIFIVCSTSYSGATLQSNTSWVTQKVTGALITYAAATLVYDNVRQTTCNCTKHVQFLALPSLATGLQLLAGKNLLPQGNIGGGLAVVGGMLTLHQIKKSLQVKGLRSYNFSTAGSQCDAVLLGASAAQLLICSYEFYKRVQAWRVGSVNEI